MLLHFLAKAPLATLLSMLVMFQFFKLLYRPQNALPGKGLTVAYRLRTWQCMLFFQKLTEEFFLVLRPLKRLEKKTQNLSFPE